MIRTDRLIIRSLRMDDAGALWQRRNHATTAKFQDWTLPYPRERADELVSSIVALDGVLPEDGWIQFAVDDASDGSSLGDLALRMSFSGRCVEVGYTIEPSAHGRGIATEATEALVAWLFDVVGVTRVGAMMHPDNLASIRVAERVGMVFEGHTRNSYWVGDENSDDWIYGMTPDAWRSWTQRSRTPASSVELVEVTRSNLLAVEQLVTHRSQQRFVSPVSGSFADALVPEVRSGEPAQPWFRAVQADDELVGFVMTTEPTEAEPVPYLWRLLIDRLHQRRGIGALVVDLVAERSRSLGAEALSVSWVDEPGTPAPLYLQRGFVPTGEIDDGEVVARLDLTV